MKLKVTFEFDDDDLRFIADREGNELASPAECEDWIKDRVYTTLQVLKDGWLDRPTASRPS